MKDLDALKNQLARDGRLQRLQEIADSTDGQKLADALDAQKIEQAARAGDTETLRQILTQVLSTDTGQSSTLILQPPKLTGAMLVEIVIWRLISSGS